MSDTPKADALKDRYCLHGMDWYLLCGELERENAALRKQLDQAALDEGRIRRENTRLVEAILNAPKAVCQESDRRAARKEAKP